MARLANQLVQVLATYTARPRTWGEIWVPLGCIAFTLRIHGEDPQTFSLFAGFFAGTMFAGLVRDQTRHQFAHPRSALLPGFALPHLLAVVAFAVCATLLTPAIVTMLQGEFLFMAAVASATFAFTSGQYKFIYNELIREVFPTLTGVAILTLYLFVGIALWGGDIAFTPANSIILLAASWTYIAANFVRLVRLREDETAYASERSTADRRLAAGHWHLQSTVFNLKRYTRKWVVSDVWNDRIGGFHHESRLRIIRLLRHGVGPWPPEFLAISFIIAALLYSAVTIYGEKTGELTGELGDWNLPPGTFRIVPVLFGLILPGAVAAPLVLGRPVLAAKLLLPLTRQQLIDNSIMASAWNCALYWTALNALSVYLIWTAPGLDSSLLRITTFVFLSAASSVAAFCSVLSYRIWGCTFVVSIIVLFFALLPSALFLTWWFTRDALSDVPFWIVGMLLLSLGLWAARQGRLAWRNVELGIIRLL